MTTQEKLQKIEQQIRKDIPRLMELKEGCWVNLTDSLGKTIGTVKVLSNVNGGISYLNATLTSVQYRSEEFFEIIGHEIMLNDWFEWLLMKTDNELYYYTIDGSVLAIHRDTEHIKDIPIDISKLYLKDQSEELIKFLYNLWKEIK